MMIDNVICELVMQLTLLERMSLRGSSLDAFSQGFHADSYLVTLSEARRMRLLK